MLLYPEIYSNPHSYCLAVATYLDGYLTDNSILHLPKRKRVDITNVKRIPHMSYWSERLHRDYRKLPDTLKLEQFVILDDDWALKTFELIVAKFGVNINAAGRVAFCMWERILFWKQYGRLKHYENGYVASAQQVAELCGCTVGFALKVIDAMLDAHLIYRKWTGNNLMGRGSCYLAGDEAHLDELLEKSNIADLT